MIVSFTSDYYKSDETCVECSTEFCTDGELKSHPCPSCGKPVPPCNVCPDMNRCGHCPYLKNKERK